jgi:hypothetical protein
VEEVVLERGGRLCDSILRIDMPHRPQRRSLDIVVVSSRTDAVAIGSMMSWPLWMAANTERRESQLRDGERSSLTVGSLHM